MKALIRWLFFIFIGLPVQGVVYVLYPFVWIYWRLAIYKELDGDFKVVMHEQVDLEIGKDSDSNGLLINPDDHGAFSMYGALDCLDGSFAALTDGKGNLVRKREVDGRLNQNNVSGDVLISWLFAFTAPNVTIKPKFTLMEIAESYLKNLGVLSFDDVNNGDVSNRCNNFGVNYCPDSEVAKLGQPAAGPQFYTSSALFALASQYSFKFKIVFWAHWLLLGGWFWAFMPIVFSKTNRLWYVQDMSMKALYVHKFVFGDRWWIRKPMEHIAFDLSRTRNDLWFAMHGFTSVYDLPESMDSFFSQREDCTSRLTDRMNGYLGKSINSLAEQARILNNRR
jgi:hypothetical protein